MKSFKDVARENKPITLVMAAIGTAYCAFRLGSVLNSCRKYTLRRSKDLKQSYGDHWAIVAGACDDLGIAFAHELADKGFKI